ncbi:MAG TPA: cyclic nucleotide-binding domain-containing protein [Kofleriaceae bacterium]
MNPRELGALEKRLEKEPGNLPLRITLAGHLREAGRVAEAVELYRSVAFAYQGQGRKQQAIAVCRSLLELAPDDVKCRALLAELVDPTTPPPAPGVFARQMKPATGTLPPPPRDSTTPLPKALPYHVHDPTTSSIALVSRRDVDLPSVEGADTRPGDEERGGDTRGLAEAARQISGLIAGDSLPAPPTDFDEAPTPTPARPKGLTGPVRPQSRTKPPMRDTAPTVPEPAPGASRDTDDDLTTPRELLAEEPLGNALFALLPAGKRDDALRRCTERTLLAGDVAIHAGETSHPLVLVVSGRLEVRGERAHGPVVLETVDPGGFVGEASLLAGAPSPQTVVAAEESVVLVLAPHALFELAGAYPAVWATLKESADRRTRMYAQVLAQL